MKPSPTSIATHQPIFLPWPGFFFKALCADAMVLLDEVQFPRGRGWMTRNRLKSDQGELWLRVPVFRKGRDKQRIRDVELCEETNWRERHLRGIRQQYANAPYLNDNLPALESIYLESHRRLVDLNLDLIRHLRQALGMKTRFLLQSELGITGKGTDLLVTACRALSADKYVTLPPAEKHINTNKLLASGIEPVFARFAPPVYPQLWGDFRYNLSTLDLLLNCGPRSLEIFAHARPRS